MKQLGDILLEGGLVTQEQLSEAYDEHQRAGRALGRVLVERGVLTESQLVAALAQQIGLKFVDLADFPLDGAAVASVPANVCRRTTMNQPIDDAVIATSVPAISAFVMKWNWKRSLMLMARVVDRRRLRRAHHH